MINDLPLLEIRDLSVDYLALRGEVRAVDNVSLTLRRGEILGLAGESGSGKSTLITALMRLQRPPAVTAGGQILLHRGDSDPIDLVTMSERQLRQLRWTKLSIVMQSAMDALNPVKRLGIQFVDVLRTHDASLSKKQALVRASELLELAGIPADRLMSFPHEMSGGMRQRSLIALALACDPDIVVMDEPTTAVDVVMQRSILSKVLELQRSLGFAVVFVTHDLSLLLELADRVAIMYAGQIVEIGPARQLYSAPQHPYTRALRDSFPPLYAPLREMSGLPGTPPDLRHLPDGCRFAPRCPKAMDRCAHTQPELLQIGNSEVACLLHDGEHSDLDQHASRTTAGVSA
ncbi:MAG TPA: ABC transporter ATP-binding protein [Microlunatus sp.]